MGLTWLETAARAGAKQGRWRHDRAGGLLLREMLAAAGWAQEQTDWVWPLVAGHHGTFPSFGGIREPRLAKGQLRGTGLWPEVQRAVVEVFTRELGYADLGEVQPTALPSRAVQLELSGLMVMADWIASDERHFPGVDELGAVGLAAARRRARAAWDRLGLRGGWRELAVPGPRVFQERFRCSPRPAQTLVMKAAQSMERPGLLVIEAPMGEGKTEAAQAAAEILAARFGADGVFVGMPTQATSDPMFTRTRRWVDAVRPGLASQVALLHGKRAFNKEWAALLREAGADPDEPFAGVDEYGCADDPYGPPCGGTGAAERQAPAEWFLASKRGLLAPFVVGTVDQLLYAATRTRHVMLRMAGLIGKIVVLDEVHACDVYMSQFLAEALRWLGQARVPVVLLSATLPPGQRTRLVEAYLAGAASREEFTVRVPEPGGYPSVTATWLGEDGRACFHVDSTASWRADLPVRVEVLRERIPGPKTPGQERIALQEAADEAVADMLAQRLVSGGTALVIRNTVARAQSLYDELQRRFGKAELRLLHGRFTAARRAELTEECLVRLGPRAPRPAGERFVLVATQLAEQSFDVDADLLVTDLAPVDLLLQRIGRLHRHDGTLRPAALQEPCVIVTGFHADPERAPDFLFASERIYGRHLLLRSAAILPADGEEWLVPSQVPRAVGQVYGENPLPLPAAWAESAAAAWEEQRETDRRRADHARQFLLTRHGEHAAPTLAGLHYGGEAAGGGEEQLEAAVRDGDESIEVVLVVRDDATDCYRTLAGRALTANGDVAPELLDEVLGSTVRLPPKVTPDALALSPLPGWRHHPWLRHSRALVLDGALSTRLGDRNLTYDEERGLMEIQGAFQRFNSAKEACRCSPL